ncbi:hypothetical protein BDV38DRAFT_279870 [Aspergillus pseudotamarii]|uniref:DUF427 domain-containing protein n=1 Tax=Aspergillus pseudotamarii TaxID=132259 RepID=A0A5N6T3L0_ASPPS|nr:uncharacterized protein BDV38DRAFT_279870 [Aspergillus pseudotamarii]KAE8140894.1 hypothetical protein BDV38DRAFT_279870 [Aspergillus pseudotamarii]
MPTAKAILNGIILAETSTWEEVEGNIYFPPSAIKESLFVKSDHTTYCGWKGDAKYFSIVLGDETTPNAAWYYPEPFDKAKHIKDFVAFYPNKIDVKVE